MSRSGPDARGGDLEFLTPSDREDLVYCRTLCRSVDDFADPAIRHILVVPKRDYRLFAPLAGGRREVRTVQDMLPVPALQLPFVRRSWLLGGRRKVSGWLLQQMVKIAGAVAAPTRAVTMVDSDIFFIKPVSAEDFIRDGRVRHYGDTGFDPASVGPDYAAYHRNASALLGLAPSDYHGADTDGPLVSWDCEVVRAMCARIEAATGTPWPLAMAAHGNGVSEYITYGAFVKHAGPEIRDRLCDTERRLCLLSWHHDLSSGAGRSDYVEAIGAAAAQKNGPIAALIQSNLRLGEEDWQDLARRIAERTTAAR